MAAMTIRNLPDETHRAIKLRAKLNKRSAEAEMRAILEQAVNPPEGIKIGTELAALGRAIGLVDLNIVRDQTPAGSTVIFK
jgi:plasmid stability protein